MFQLGDINLSVRRDTDQRHGSFGRSAGHHLDLVAPQAFGVGAPGNRHLAPDTQALDSTRQAPVGPLALASHGTTQRTASPFTAWMPFVHIYRAMLTFWGSALCNSATPAAVTFVPNRLRNRSDFSPTSFFSLAAHRV